jgi:putative transcriptional regulator
VVEVIDMVTYDRLWETMKAKGVTQYRLIKYYGISAGQIGRLKKNMYVSTHTLDVLCNILKCPVEDIIEIRQDEEDCVPDFSECENEKQN